VLEVLAHINKRVKPAVHITLPMDKLLEQYNSDSAPAFQKNFNLIYLQMGFARLPEEVSSQSPFCAQFSFQLTKSINP
jgi:hypothetical protein